MTDLPSIYLRAGHYFLGLEIDKWRRRDEMSIAYQAYSGRAIAKALLVLLKPPEELFRYILLGRVIPYAATASRKVADGTQPIGSSA